MTVSIEELSLGEITSESFRTTRYCLYRCKNQVLHSVHQHLIYLRRSIRIPIRTSMPLTTYGSEIYFYLTKPVESNHDTER